MYEDSNRFSWTNLFIKIIIIIIFILFTVWLISLSTKNITQGMSNSLGVLTDGIFSQNVDKMKEVGKSYFTTERLPQKVGEIKTLSLAKMYDENLILELKDKNGNACSAKNSYVKVEKMENEYQMKVYLECGDESDFINVIMGCYNYCNTDICEKKTPDAPTNTGNQAIEYQYSKTTGGAWTDYGSWSEWSKTQVTATSSRQVDTKVVAETYTYDKTVTETKYVGEANCPSLSGYTLVSRNNGVCSYNRTVVQTADAVCPSTYSGYVLVSQDGYTCNYSKDTTSTVSPLACAQTYNGYTLVSQNGFTCNYSKSTSSSTNPTACPSTSDGYSLTSQDGFTCNYSKTTSSSTNPSACPSTSDGYSLTSQSGFTCNYSKTTSSSTNPSACASTYNGYNLTSQNGFTCNYSKQTSTTDTIDATKNKEWVPGTPGTTDCYQVAVGSKLVGGVMQTIYETRCSTSGGTSGHYTYTYTCPKGYKLSGSKCTGTKTSTVTTTTTASCPSGYSKSGNSCVKSTTATKTTTTSCPSGYTKSGNICVKAGTATTTTTTSCPSGYTKSGNSCVKGGTVSTTTTASCPSGYEKRNGYCVRECVSVITKDMSCATGQTLQNGKCYANVTSTQKVTDTRNVTYYRYRERTYVGGTIDYRWSRSNNDTSLINAGYRLTGQTRVIAIGGK